MCISDGSARLLSIQLLQYCFSSAELKGNAICTSTQEGLLLTLES